MKILALDTSSLVATVAVMDGKKLLGEYTINSPMTHSQKLMPIIDNLLKQLSLTIRDMNYIAVSKGPGSFTGIRIGIATVKGLAQAVDIPILSVSSLEGLAYNLSHTDLLICPIMDARRNQVYTGIYQWKNRCLERVIEEAPMAIEELMEILSSIEKDIIFLGDGIDRFQDDIIKSLGDRAIMGSPYIAMQRASSIAQLAMDKLNKKEIIPENHFTLIPTYLRKSEAERQYEEKKRKRE